MNQKIAVLKFGGTSVANEEGRYAAINWIEKYLDDNYSVVVVVSAMGRIGAPYATDTLINLLKNSGSNDIIKDFMASCGELISSSVMADMLSSKGMQAIPLSGGQAGIITNYNYNDAQIIQIKNKRILKELKSGNIVVLAGFQGVNESGYITTLGRGGSDITALQVGCSVGATEIVIFSDIEGVSVTDPRIIPEAEVYSEMSAYQLYLMACNGANVIHPRAVKTAMENKIDFYIRSTFLDKKGTLICSREKADFKKIAGIAVNNTDNEKDEVCVIYDCSANEKITRMDEILKSELLISGSKKKEQSGQYRIVYSISCNKTKLLVRRVYNCLWKENLIWGKKENANAAKI